jgi:hypothetical protein
MEVPGTFYFTILALDEDGAVAKAQTVVREANVTSEEFVIDVEHAFLPEGEMVVYLDTDSAPTVADEEN